MLGEEYVLYPRIPTHKGRHTCRPTVGQPFIIQKHNALSLNLTIYGYKSLSMLHLMPADGWCYYWYGEAGYIMDNIYG